MDRYVVAGLILLAPAPEKKEAPIVGTWKQAWAEGADFVSKWEFKKDGTFVVTSLSRPISPLRPSPKKTGKWKLAKGNVIRVRYDKGTQTFDFHLRQTPGHLKGHMVWRFKGELMKMPVIFKAWREH
jgi:hypothetical protein